MSPPGRDVQAIRGTYVPGRQGSRVWRYHGSSRSEMEGLTMRDLRILLVDDHEVVRLGVKALLSRHPRFEVIGEAGAADEAVTKARVHKPDVVVMDIRLAGKSGIDATREIVAAQPETKVII